MWWTPVFDSVQAWFISKCIDGITFKYQHPANDLFTGCWKKYKSQMRRVSTAWNAEMIAKLESCASWSECQGLVENHQSMVRQTTSLLILIFCRRFIRLFTSAAAAAAPVVQRNEDIVFECFERSVVPVKSYLASAFCQSLCLPQNYAPASPIFVLVIVGIGYLSPTSTSAAELLCLVRYCRKGIETIEMP